MKKITLLRELEKYPVFTLKTFMGIIKKESAYSKLYLHRLKGEGLIFKIEKNKYTTHRDPMLIASNITWPSYLSSWTALRYHNLTEQLPHDIFVITTRSRKNRVIEFMGTKIFFKRVNPKYFFGYGKEIYGKFNIFVAEAEKALVDCALFKMVSFSEISDIIKEHVDIIDKKKMFQYCLKSGNMALIKRFGFLLDALGEDFSKIAFNLNSNLTSNYTLLDTSLSGQGTKNKKWRLIENA